MKNETLVHKVNIPSLKDFVGKYPQFSRLASVEGNFLFEIIMKPEVFITAKVLSDFELPAVLAVAEAGYKNSLLVKGFSFDNHVKQFMGAAICSLMEANSYYKTGIKKSIPHPNFNRGEFYRPFITN